MALAAPTIKPAKLSLTPNHLYYLLSRFEELGVNVGLMNIRLENIHADTAPGNYVSFLGHAPRSRGKSSDADSLRSVSSVRSVMSSVSSVWSALTFSNSTARAEKRDAQHRDDVRYLYSCFTKIPALKLSPAPGTRLIAGFEEFPFDSAVPLWVFKNLSSLEISDLDFRQFYGWDTLAKQLRSLTLRRAHVDDPLDILLSVVLDDMDKRRRRSSRAPVPTTPLRSGAPWPSASPKPKSSDPARSSSAPNSPSMDQRPAFAAGSPGGALSNRVGSADGKTPLARQRSSSPAWPSGSTHGSTPKPHLAGTASKFRRSSGSSGSSLHESTPRHSAVDLIGTTLLPSSSWQFLRHLSLADNGLHDVTAASFAPVAGTLQSLDLSGNLFTEVPDALASLTYLRALNLSNCMIESLHSLARNPLPAITTLNLRSNRLLSLAGVEKLYSLERVDLRDNRLHDPTELARLTSFPDLTHVYVSKNPFTRTHGNYRVTIFNLFRSAPGHSEDVIIDQIGPMFGEKKKLVDWAPELPNVQVVKPVALEDERAPRSDASRMEPSAMERELLASHTHRRAVSDAGPRLSQRRKRAARRRIVELTQASPPRAPVSGEDVRDSVTPLREVVPKPESEVEEPVTPDQTVYYTAPPTQTQDGARPPLDASHSSPTRAPRIRDASDDDDDDDEGTSTALGAQEADGNADMYRQKLEALKTDLGPNWLNALNENRFGGQQRKDRSFSPASRTSTIRPDNPNHSISVGGRTLG